MFCIKSSDLILIMESMYPFTILTSFSSFPRPWQPAFYTLFYEFHSFPPSLPPFLPSFLLFFLPYFHSPAPFFVSSFLDSTDEHLSFSAWLIKLSTMPSSFIPVVSNGRISFSFKEMHIFFKDISGRIQWPDVP